MEIHALLEMVHLAERLKDNTRHCITSGGRHESVAEHSWRLALMAFWIKDEFPQADMNKVIAMCLIHDLGEAFTGDIPVFDKTSEDEEKEVQLLYAWVDSIPSPMREEMKALYHEMEERSTLEAKIYKTLDGFEALIAHNESDISTWEPQEYDLQMHYCDDRVGFSEYMTQLREQIRQDSIDKIREAEDKK